jgi:ribosomal protein S18 acetylase RimI-like enzyme
VHEIRQVLAHNPRDTAWAARLHLQLFRDMGPMAQLGELFLRRFCYSLLVQDGLMRAALCEVDGQPAGLIAYTDKSITFHRAAWQRRWPYVAWLVGLSVLRDPRVLPRLVKAARLMSSRRGEVRLGEDPMAEVLAIGVLPEYRSPQFLRRTGLKIADLLLAHAATEFRQLGLAQMRMIVDADNRAALLFYHRLGARFERYEQAGVPSTLVWLATNGRTPA